MSADPRIYDSGRLARCYAHARPPVHEAICARLFAALPKGHQVHSALDVGCGAGASTAALVVSYGSVMGIDPYLPMLRQANDRVPTATFVQATATTLPARTSAVDLVTAAGSLNYTDIDLSLAEVARVLSPNGYLAVYDFSTGRILPRNSAFETSFHLFEQRFPRPPGYALDLARLPYERHGLRLTLHETFVVEVKMTHNEYVEYVMGETNVEVAISDGLSELEAREECAEIFGPFFKRGATTAVGFASVLALARRCTPPATAR